MANTAQEATAGPRSVADRLYRTCEDARDVLQRTIEMVRGEMQRVADCIKEEVGKMTDGIIVAAAMVGASGSLHPVSHIISAQSYPTPIPGIETLTPHFI